MFEHAVYGVLSGLFEAAFATLYCPSKLPKESQELNREWNLFKPQSAER